MDIRPNPALLPSSDWTESSSAEAQDPAKAEKLAAEVNAQSRVAQQPATAITGSQETGVSAAASGISASAVGRHAFNALATNAPSQTTASFDSRAPTSKTGVREVARAINNLNVNNMEAWRILEASSQKNYELDAKLSTAANKANFTAKQAAIKDLQQQIHGERVSAVTQLAFSIGGATTTAGMSAGANKLLNTAEKPNSMKDLQAKLQDKNLTAAEKDALKQNWVEEYKNAKYPQANGSASLGPSAGKGAATANTDTSDESFNQFHAWRASQNNGGASPNPNTIKTDFEEFLNSKVASSSQTSPKVRGEIMQSSAAATGNVVNQVGTTVDTLGGGRYQADQAKMAQKEDDMQSTIAQQVVDASKSAKDRDLKNFSDALDTVKQATQRWASVIDKIG